MHPRMTGFAWGLKWELMWQYMGFNIFKRLTIPMTIGSFYLLMQRTPLMRLIQSECCGRFDICGCLEIVLFLTVIVTIPSSS